ncbi:TOBE domain-containing protein [Primorskyibacter flagellatus]|uniref:TOBE domain-containing protein n=2 Tax=Primorskyibacter flagellatus TaxID=1387277 RepID=A0A1W2EIU0_9RHOB|nr:TOBE domain-containing protein [Primorskyibacter flagellatus]
MSSVPDRSVLNRPSYAAGDERGTVPKQVIRFLNSPSGRALLRSIWADVFARKLARTDKNEIARRVREAAEMLGLQPYLARYPRQLSGGQRQRVAMGRAMVRKPSVFLFDEPLSNLDAKLSVQMRAEIKQNHQRLGTTTAYVTHDQIEAMTMADRIVVLQGGRIEQIGTPLDLYDRPANLFVAGFIGAPAMNRFEGTLDGNEFVAKDGSRIPLGIKVRNSDGLPVTLGIRPEHLHIDDEGGSAEVLTVEPTGLDTQVIVRFAGKKATCIFRQLSDLPLADRTDAIECLLQKVR